jgi:hypothetical protein
MFSLVNAIFCFTAVYFNIKNRPHHIISKDEAKVFILVLLDLSPLEPTRLDTTRLEPSLYVPSMFRSF